MVRIVIAAALGCACLVGLSTGLHAADEGAAPPADKPPTVAYDRSRRSAKWITMPSGSRVAVDKGAAWKGVHVYISMTGQLIGVDQSTGTALFFQPVSAFWRGFTFKQVTPTGGALQWAIELRPGTRNVGTAAMRQYHALRSGTKLAVPGLDDTPSGTKRAVRAHWTGAKSSVAERFAVLVSTPANWTSLKTALFEPASAPTFGDVDFSKEVLVVISSGNSSNCSGFTPMATYENDERLLLRVVRKSFQTMNGFDRTRPWAVFVLPRRAKKSYVIERNVQGLIGGPPIWRTLQSFPQVGPADAELKTLPQRTDATHEGWDDGSDHQGDPSPKRRPPPPVRPK